jgi:hypothetical protein
MKAIRTHDYRIDRVRECEFYQSRYRQRAFDLQGFLEARRSRKRNPDCMAKGRSKPFGKARTLFLPDDLFRRKKRVAVFLRLHGSFSGGYAASRRWAGLLAAWETGESHDWILFGDSNPLS